MNTVQEILVDTREPEVHIRAMLTMNRAIDLFAGDLTRRGCSDRTRDTYTRILGKFADRLPVDGDVSRITADDCRRFLDLYNRKAAGTRAHTHSVLSSFFKWLIVTEQIRRSPMTTIPKPKRRRAEELDVVTVSRDDVKKLLAAGQTWTERLAIAIPVYIGPRRRAVAQLRLADYDRDRQRIRFFEKGGKVIWKPVPNELANLLAAALADGAIRDPDDFLVPPEGPLRGGALRDDRIIWRVVKKVAHRAGVECHVHALRAAFAVFYLEQNPGDTQGLKELLGHRSYETTQVYLRKFDTEIAMERVRTLSWSGREAEHEDTDAVIGSLLEELGSSVYFIAAGDYTQDGTPVKIGTASDVGSRIADLQVGHHEELVLVATTPGGAKLERQFHDALADDRIRGEWFRATDRMRAITDALQTRTAATDAANPEPETSLLVGAGGFEPPYLAEADNNGESPQLFTDALSDEARRRVTEPVPAGVPATNQEDST